MKTWVKGINNFKDKGKVGLESRIIVIDPKRFTGGMASSNISQLGNVSDHVYYHTYKIR
jgi:hypothetical protein